MIRKLKIAAASLLLFLGAGAALVSWVLTYPGTVINSETAAWALRRFGGGFWPRWESLEVEAVSLGLLTKELRVNARGFCFDQASGAARGCFRSLSARVVVELSRRGLKAVRLERLELRGDFLRVDRTRVPVRGGPEDGDGLPAWPAFLKIGTVDARLPSTRVILGPGRSLLADARVEYRGGRLRPLSFEADGVWRDGATAREFRAEAALALDGEEAGAALDALARLEVEDAGRFEATARLTGIGGAEPALRAQATARAGDRLLRAELRGRRTSAAYEGRVELRASDPDGAVPRAGLDPCEVTAPLRDGEPMPASVEAECRFWADPAVLRDGRLGFRRVRGTAKLSAALEPREGEADRFQAGAEVALDPHRGWYELEARGSARAEGRLGKLGESLRVRHELAARLQVRRFGELVEQLDGTRFAVPAPLRALRGPVSLRATSRGSPRDSDRSLDVELRTDLRGGRQRLKSSVRGTLLVRRPLEADRSLRAEVDAVLENVSLVLPYLEIQGLPSLRVDPRIDASTAAAASPPGGPPLPLAYEARVRTAGRPARLHSNLAEEPVPVAIDLRVSRSSAAAGTEPPAPVVAGTVEVQEFDVEVFGRKGTIDHVRLVKRPGTDTAQLDGAIETKTPDAEVRILLLGSTKKPRVEFTSEPPMGKQQIISLLLYGKAPSQLDSEQAATVGNLDAGLATRAFGLASLYLFASTPIQYVGYNPQTQSYSVTLRLPGGATAELGADLEETRRLRLRKRLAPHWAIETELRSSAAEERRLVTTFLEWFNRY